MPLVVIAAAALCYLPYLSVGWGFLDLTKASDGRGFSAATISGFVAVGGLWFGEHQGDVVAYVCWLSGPLVQGASVARSAHPTIASSLADITCCYSCSLVVVAHILGIFWSSRRLQLVWLPTELGRFDRSALAVEQLDWILHSRMVQINSIRRSFAGLGLCGLEDPDAASPQSTVIAMAFRRNPAGFLAPLDSAPYHESVTGERSEVASVRRSALSRSDQPLQLLCTTCPRTTRSSSRRQIWLGPVHVDVRPGTRTRARGSARRRSPCWSLTCPKCQILTGPQRLRPVSTPMGRSSVRTTGVR